MSGTDFLAEATDELYGSDPEGFTERRAALAAQARAAGDRPAASQIAGLRKPTRPAWIINQLVRDDPGVAARLAGLGDDLRAAAAALDGARIRELSQARRRLIDSLIRQALQQAGEQSPPAALREDLTATFGAALADPEVARELAAGTLLRAVHRADFSAGIPELSLVPPVADTVQATQSGPGRGNRAGQTRPPGPAKAAPGARAAQPAEAGDARAAEHEQAAEAARETRAAGEAAAREARARDAARAASAEAARAAKAERAAEERRRAVADAEQALADATRAADQAAAAERDQRGQVRALEDQLDEARRQLAGARRRVRETQAARQTAQRALSRLRPAR
ncbi:MAG TPA: hypothetical protein VF933_24755 [Streptosporangiaceae bacterium]